MVIFKGRGCVTLIRTRGTRVLPLGVEHIKKRSRIKQNAVTFKGRGCVSLIKQRGTRVLPLRVCLTQKDSKTVKK